MAVIEVRPHRNGWIVERVIPFTVVATALCAVQSASHSDAATGSTRWIINPPGLASLFVQSPAYQTSVTLPVAETFRPLWTRIVSALATWISTKWLKSMYTMWPAEPCPLVIVEAMLAGDSKPTHQMPLLGLRIRLT